MPITPTPADGTRVIKAGDLVLSGYLEAGIHAAGEPLNAADAAWGLEKLQRLIDVYNSIRGLINNVQFLTFAIIPNQALISIGPTGDFKVPVGQTDPLPARPLKIMTAGVVLSGTTESPLEIVDDQWWADNAQKGQISTIPSVLYYSPDVPNGSIYLWPVPSIANNLILQVWTPLTDPATLDTIMALPNAYWSAIVYTLAVELCPSFNREAGGTLLRLQAQAVKAVIGNNSGSPRMRTDGAGLSGASSRPDFNFLTGERG